MDEAARRIQICQAQAGVIWHVRYELSADKIKSLDLVSGVSQGRERHGHMKDERQMKEMQQGKKRNRE